MADDESGDPSAKKAWDSAKGKTEGEDQRQAAENDGTEKRNKPRNSISIGAASFSPTGSVPVKKINETDITVTVQTETTGTKTILLDRNDITLEEQRYGLTVLLRIDDHPSERGLKGGRVSRLTVTEGKIGEESILAHFENGEWDHEAETFAAVQAVMEAEKEHNGLEEEPAQEKPNSIGGHHRRDRPDDPGMEI
ncbi:MAG: hypothetical protein AAF367_01465 [Pseudomonadota bacterium]